MTVCAKSRRDSGVRRTTDEQPAARMETNNDVTASREIFMVLFPTSSM